MVLDDVLRFHPRIERGIRVLKHDLHSRRAWRRRPREREHVFAANLTEPEVGSTRRSISGRSSISAADSPTRPKVSPSSIPKLTSSTAVTTLLRLTGSAAVEALDEMDDLNEASACGQTRLATADFELAIVVR